MNHAILGFLCGFTGMSVFQGVCYWYWERHFRNERTRQ